MIAHFLTNFILFIVAFSFWGLLIFIGGKIADKFSLWWATAYVGFILAIVGSLLSLHGGMK